MAAARVCGACSITSAAIASNWWVFANYAYLRNHAATNPLETTQYSRRSGSIGAWTSLGAGWTVSAAYYGSSGNGLGQSDYGRTDLTVGKSFAGPGHKIETALSVRRLDNLEQTYFRDFGATGTLRTGYDSRWQLFGQVRVSF